MRQQTKWTGIVLVAAMVAASSGALLRAGNLTAKYDSELRRLRNEWRTAQQNEGLDPNRGRKALYGKYPTPEITLVKPIVTGAGTPSARRPCKISSSGR